MQDTTSMLPTSAHFELKQIAEGVYAAIAVAGGGARSNAGIIDLGDHTHGATDPVARAQLRAELDGIIAHAQPGSVGRVGHEISFPRYFYKYQPPRSLEKIEANIEAGHARIMKLLEKAIT